MGIVFLLAAIAAFPDISLGASLSGYRFSCESNKDGTWPKLKVMSCYGEGDGTINGKPMKLRLCQEKEIERSVRRISKINPPRPTTRSLVNGSTVRDSTEVSFLH